MAIISIQEMQDLIAQSFFNGDVGIAGIVMYAVILMAIFLLFSKNNLMICFALMFPITLIFTTLNVLPTTMAVLMVLVAVIGLAKERRDNMS